MATATLFPSRETELLTWAQNLGSRLNASPTTFNVTAAQCTAFNALVTAYQTALAACDPNTRNKAAVVTKNEAREAMKANARLLANAVNASATVTDAQKLQLGLTVRKPDAPIPAPTSAPAIKVLSMVGRVLKIQLVDNDTTNKRGKPAGVAGATVFSFVGATPPDSVNGWKFEGNTTRTSFDLQIDDGVPPGATVWITAFWRNPRDQSGPAALPIKVTVQYALTMAA